MKDAWKVLVVIIAGFLAVMAFRHLIKFLVRRMSKNELLTSSYMAKRASLLDVPAWIFCSGIFAFFLFQRAWLLWLGLGAGILIIPAFFLIRHRARRKTGTFADFLEEAAELTGTPLSESLRRQIQESRERKAAGTSPVKTETASPPPANPGLPAEEEAHLFAAQIPNHAERHRQLARGNFGLDLNYDVESIATLDQMIRLGWPDGPPAMLPPVVIGFGSYLGETIRHVHGGDWCYNEKHGLHFQIAGGGLKLFPFASVEKRLLNGETDSLALFYAEVRSKVARGGT